MTSSSDSLTADGLDLFPATEWCWVEDLSSLMAGAGRRGANITVPGRHGAIRTPSKRAAETACVLPLWVFGRDPDTGAVPADPHRQLHANLDRLRRLFNAPTVRLVHTWAGAGAREAIVEPAGDPFAVERHRTSPPTAKLGIPLLIPAAFWADTDPVTQLCTGPTGSVFTLDEFAEATAPIADLVITALTAVSNPMWIHGDRSLQYEGVVSAGRQLVLDTGAWSVSAGTGAAWSPDPRQVRFSPGPGWLELDPSRTPFDITFTHTGGGDASFSITGRRMYHNP